MMKKLLLLFCLGTFLIALQADAKTTTYEPNEKHSVTDPQPQVQKVENVWVINDLEPNTRINILKLDYSELQSHKVSNTDFNISNLKLDSGSYIIQIIGTKNLSQKEIHID